MSNTGTRLIDATESIVEMSVILLLFFMWMHGIALAKGFWMTWGALFPPYGIYLSVEKFAGLLGWL